MGDADFLFSGFGAYASPIFGADVEDEQLYSVCDPVRDRLLGLFSAAINYELGHATGRVKSTSPWAVVRVGTALVDKLPVADTLAENPDRKLMMEAKFLFPLLALYRGAEEDEEFTLDDDLIRCTWGLHYILGPLSPEDGRRLKGALVLAHRLVSNVIEWRGHPAYEGGADQFNEDTGGLNSIKVVGCAYEPEAFGGDGPQFCAAHMTLETTELSTGELEGAFSADFEGVSISGGIGGPDGIMPARINVDTSVPQQAPFGKPPLK